jgi:agmatinase
MSLDRSQFFGLPSRSRGQADALILPLPLEETVSYGKGTQGGPQAILNASLQVELFDEETRVDFAEFPKLHTLPPLAGLPPLPADDAAYGSTVPECLAEISSYVAVTAGGKFLLTLGGEHLLTFGVIDGLAEDLAGVTIVQIDAHADLADTLGGRRWSHGTVMRRLWEGGCRLVQIGIRSLSRPEYDLIASNDRIVTFFAHDLAQRWPEVIETLAALEGKLYLSLDVDGLDPAVIPSTGTPQPGGLNWRQMMDVLQTVAAALKCHWIGADVVEFIPSPNPPGCDPAAARLAMKLLAFWAKGKGLGIRD